MECRHALEADRERDEVATLPFDVYDADHHLYEPEEAFTRHLPKICAPTASIVSVLTTLLPRP